MPTKFQKKVWQYAKKVPKGRITTYKLLARALGDMKAARAVGNALNKNPYAPRVPCHRVIKSDGRAGGFAKGKKIKIRLLAREGIEFIGDKVIDFEKHLFKY